MEERALTKKERRERRREERRHKLEKSMRSRTFKKIAVIAVLVIVLGLAVYGIYLSLKKGERELGTDYSQVIPDQGRPHIPRDSSHEPYNSNPPTSGPHWADPVRPGVFDKSQPDEGLIHSLEHGAVWISYKSSIPDSAKKKIRELAGNQGGVVLTIRDQNDSDIALAAWTRLDKFNLNPDGSFDEGRILDFITRYRNKGPEQVPFMTGIEY